MAPTRVPKAVLIPLEDFSLLQRLVEKEGSGKWSPLLWKLISEALKARGLKK